MGNTSPDSFALPLVQYNASLVAPAWGPHPSVLELEGSQLRVRDVELREELGEPWQMSVHVMSNSAQFDPARLVGADFSLHMLREDAANPAENDGRFFHGVVHRSSYVGSFADAYHARLWVGPAVELLANTRRARIFQDLTVVEIAQEVAGELLAARGRELDISRLVREYGPRDYCVQYQESDLAFVQRVLAEEGISIGFEADEGYERTVLYDDRDRFESVLRTVEGLDSTAPPQHVLVRGDRGELSPDETISGFSWRRTVHSVHAGVEQWDWKQAAPANLQATVTPEGGEAPWHHGEHYQHGDRRLQEADGGDGLHADNSLDHAERMQQRVSLEASTFDGRGNVMSMMPGATFELDGHPDAELNGPYYCLRVTHHADDASAELGAAGGTNYDNDFVCAPLASAYAPAPRSRPRIFGLQTATVVGPASEEINTDAYGRVKVRMHWDREQRAQDDDTSCWLRVVQSWAGAGFGSQFIPRVGMEVLVSFLGGDPDRPVCVGTVYNGRNMPPYTLPDDKTKSGIRTQSSPGGQGNNELRFDDAAGNEEVYIHAQKDMNERVLNAHAMRVGATQNVSVGSSQSVSVGGTRQVSITGHHTMKVGAPPPEDAEAGAGAGPSNHELTVTGDIHQSSDQSILVEAPLEIKLVCGGTSSLTLTPHGIMMQAGGGAKVDLTAAISILAAGGAMGMTVSDGGFMNMKSNAGGEMQLDGELHAKTAGGSKLDMTGDVEVAAGQGAKMLLNGDISAQGGAIRNKSNGATLDLTSAIEGRAQNVALAAGATKLELSGPEIKMVTNAANITGFAMVSIGAPTVKIN